jgi:hypothetical protein
MAENVTPTNAQTMIKSGDQPRATDKSISEVRSPASISYVRYGINKNPGRSVTGRTTSRS